LFFFLTVRPQYLISFGGYATFPLLVAAVITKTKIILHEQNSHLGKVNRIFAKFASKIALSFAETSGITEENLSKTVFVGNPVRQEILDLSKISYSLPNFDVEEEKPLNRDNKMGYNVLLASEFSFVKSEKPKNFFNILVIGGSGGARIFSEILPKAFFNLSESVKERIQITQQSRKELMRATFEQYKSFNINITIDAFFEDMPELIRASHLVIARSGSSSVFEFCAAKKPMILVPFALAADNHQEKNARYLEKQGAAIVVNEAEFTINKMNELLRNLIDNPAILKKMSENAAALAVLDATKNLASLV
jgi:UDP-N-acetylglucosamine--N-acetylmuramyl-(pentapeptide) pyrophosphoryl-undecaprenol N-acetylglucosamine transferase